MVRLYYPRQHMPGKAATTRTNTAAAIATTAATLTARAVPHATRAKTAADVTRKQVPLPTPGIRIGAGVAGVGADAAARVKTEKNSSLGNNDLPWA